MGLLRVKLQNGVIGPVERRVKNPLRGVTVDNPYQYAIGERNSTTLKHPEWINWSDV